MLSLLYNRAIRSRVVERLLFEPDISNRQIYFIQIHPASVKHISSLPRDPYLFGPDAKFGVTGGWWDRLRKAFREHYMFDTVADLLNGADIRQTANYRKMRETRSDEKAYSDTEKLITLTKLLKENGYSSQYELGGLREKRRIGPVEVPSGEMVVGMDRNGDFMRLLGGRHRLAVAQQIGIERITAILTLIHERAVEKLPANRRMVIAGEDEEFRPF